MKRGDLNLLALSKRCKDEETAISIKIPSRSDMRVIHIEGEATAWDNGNRKFVSLKCSKELSLDDIEFTRSDSVVDFAINDILAEIEKQRRMLRESNMLTLPPME